MLRCYMMTAWHRGYLCLDPGSGVLASARRNSRFLRYPPLLAHFPDEGGAIAALAPLVEPDATIAIAPHPYCNAALPVRAIWRDARRVALLHPLSLRYLSVRPIGRGEPLGTVAAEADRAGEQETFELFEAPESLVMAPVLARLEAAAALLRPPHVAAAVLHYIARSDSALAGIALDAALPLLPLEQLEQLAAGLLRDPEALARLGVLLPDDVWAAQGLPKLRDWLARRDAGSADPLRHVAIGPDLDFLARAGQGHYVSLAHACNALARRKVRPRRALCVIASVRNQGTYLLEWLAYHRGIGAEEFFLYGNDNLDDSDLLLVALAEAGEIVWIANRATPENFAEAGNAAEAGGFADAKAFSHALNLLPDVLDYRWAAILSPDQFLVFDPARFASAAAFLAWHDLRDVDAIACDQIRVGAAGERVRAEGPVIRRCRDWVGPRTGALVALFRPHGFIHNASGPRADERHDPLLREANADPLSRRRPPPAAPVKIDAAAEYAAIHHYVFKSAEEYLWSLCSGIPIERAFDRKSNESLRQYLETPAREGFADRIDRCAPALDADIARLRALPGVADAEARVEQAYRARIRHINEAWRPHLAGIDLA